MFPSTCADDNTLSKPTEPPSPFSLSLSLFIGFFSLACLVVIILCVADFRHDVFYCLRSSRDDRHWECVAIARCRQYVPTGDRGQGARVSAVRADCLCVLVFLCCLCVYWREGDVRFLCCVVGSAPLILVLCVRICVLSHPIKNRDWNSNSKNVRPAHALLQCIFKKFKPETLEKLPQSKQVPFLPPSLTYLRPHTSHTKHQSLSMSAFLRKSRHPLLTHHVMVDVCLYVVD